MENKLRRRRKRKKSRTAFLSALLYLFIGMGAFFMVVYAGEYFFREREEPPAPPSLPAITEAEPTPHIIPLDEEESWEVVLYFTDDQFISLIGERRLIDAEGNYLERVLEELLRGPQDETLFNPIPPDTRLNGVFSEGGTVYVDLDEQMIEGQAGGSSQELLSIYSIINTLTETPAVQRVKILIDGQERETLRGHMDTSRPLERDEKLIAEVQ